MQCIYNAGIREFREGVCNKKIYCFGSGKYAQAAVNVLLYAGLKEKIKGFVDNNQLKWGGQFICDDFVAPIISIEEMIKSFGEKVILITCGDVVGVMEQLANCSELEDVVVYIWQLILSKDFSKIQTSVKIEKAKEQLIPKKIHYCWFGGKPIPEKFLYYIEGWREKCPDYEIIRWDESNYDVTKCLYMKQAYDCRKWGFVPDYARLDIIYHEGGIYLDTDVELIKNLDELLYQEAFAGLNIRKYVSLGLGFGAKKGHPFIKELRDYYDDKAFIDQNGEIDLCACDLHQYNVFKKYDFSLDGSFQKIRGISLYPTAYFDARNSYTQKEYITDNTFSIHHNTVSWFSDTMKEDMEKRNMFFEALEHSIYAK